MRFQEIISALIILSCCFVQISDGNTITIGKEAEVKCKELKKSCSQGNLCVIRHLQWPMNMSFPMCIPESEISVKLRICQKPPAPGNCGARWVRWYFNTHIQKCTWFYYQGCRGNENNFKSKAECEAECMPHQQTNVIQKPLIYGLTGSQMVVSRPIDSPEYTNHIGVPSVRSKKVTHQDRELRRKRRLEKRRQKRLRKLMRKRRKSMRGRKRRREGKTKSKKGKKKRKNKKNKKKGKRVKKKSKSKKSTIKLIPGKGDDITNTNDLVKKFVAQEPLKEKKKNSKQESKS